MKKKLFICLIACLSAFGFCQAQSKSLLQLQQDFIDLRFGMFIHFNIPTFSEEDWPDPNTSPELFYPARLDCRQWAKAAKSAGMKYGCLTTKHHSGFCIWNTATTNYSVMSSPLKRDVVKEYADAFRENGLKVMLYYSILDTHHFLRKGWTTREHIDMVKNQLRELLTGYGPITAIIIDGWDAPWSRLSYDEVPFEEIYRLIKSIQPECLVMDLNAAKYPADALFYTDIKSYEQGAGQHISKDSNTLPALSCLPINSSWFWKKDFPTTPVKDVQTLVDNNLKPMGDAYCNFILNVAPNRDGLIDDNAVKALAKIGKLWKNPGRAATLKPNDAPIISTNLAKGRRADSSWSWGPEISDLATDDNFTTGWVSQPSVKQPFLTVYLDREQRINMIAVTERDTSTVRRYRFGYRVNGQWQPLLEGNKASRVKIHRFSPVYADAVRMTVLEHAGNLAIAEMGVYNER